MGMISEAHAELTAKKLEGIILKAMNDPLWNNWLSGVKNFVKEELVEWYYDECGETYGCHNPHPDILKMFPSKES